MAAAAVAAAPAAAAVPATAAVVAVAEGAAAEPAAQPLGPPARFYRDLVCFIALGKGLSAKFLQEVLLSGFGGGYSRKADRLLTYLGLNHTTGPGPKPQKQDTKIQEQQAPRAARETRERLSAWVWAAARLRRRCS